MCCHDEPAGAQAPEGNEPMVKVYARDEGSAFRIDNYGEATFEKPAEVPEAVAEELAGDPRLRVEKAPWTSAQGFTVAPDLNDRMTFADAPSEAPEPVAEGSQEQDEAPRGRKVKG